MAKKNQKKNTAKSIMKMISDKDIAFVDFRFTDPRGKWQHTAQTVSSLDEGVLNEGIMFDGSSSLDPDGTVNNWLWQINGQSFSGSSVKVLLGEGTHTVRLTVTDNLDSSITIEGLFSLGPVSMVSNLNSDISKTDIELSWSGNAEEYRIYRSSYSTETLDEMQLVGITSENSWNEIAPIASNLYYAVTMVVGDNEILWLDNETNIVSVDATSATNHADDSPTGSITILSIPLTLIFLILAISSLVISLQDKKRRSQ